MSATTSNSADTIERILCLCPRVHIYSIPPLTSNKGHTAASWTADPARQIFTARLRVLESATPIPPSSTSSVPSSNTNSADGEARAEEDKDEEKITTTILLEDPTTGALFAAAPYTSPTVVEPAQDSSRFFAVRVVAPQEDGKKQQTAMLGVGFEDRADAVDFGICLQEARKVLGFDRIQKGGPPNGNKTGPGGTRNGDVEATGQKDKELEKRDWSLKEGETIKIDIAGKGRRRMMDETSSTSPSPSTGNGNDAKAAFFSIKPPPPPPSSSSSSSTASAMIPTLLPPPPSGASDARTDRRRSREVAPPPPLPAPPPTKSEAEAAGFDDGEFGEFQ